MKYKNFLEIMLDLDISPWGEVSKQSVFTAN